MISEIKRLFEQLAQKQLVSQTPQVTLKLIHNLFRELSNKSLVLTKSEKGLWELTLPDFTRRIKPDGARYYINPKGKAIPIQYKIGQSVYRIYTEANVSKLCKMVKGRTELCEIVKDSRYITEEDIIETLHFIAEFEHLEVVKNAKLKGFEIKPEVIESNPRIIEWMNQLATKLPQAKDILTDLILKTQLVKRNPPILIGFHGTSQENANKVLKNGFKIEDSENMFFGKGIYLSYRISDALFYKNLWDKSGKSGVILKVELPKSFKWGVLTQEEGIGTLEQFVNDQMNSLYWYEDQIKSRIIENNLKDFPQIDLSLDHFKDMVEANLFDSTLKAKFPQISNEIFIDYDEDFYIASITNIIKNLGSKEKREEFYNFISGDSDQDSRWGIFGINPESYKEYVTKDYYNIAENFSDYDVDFAPTQFIIRSKKVLKGCKISLMASKEIEEKKEIEAKTISFPKVIEDI